MSLHWPHLYCRLKKIILVLRCYAFVFGTFNCTLCADIGDDDDTRYDGVYGVCTYWSTSRTQKESMNGKFPAMASNSACEMKPSLSWS